MKRRSFLKNLGVVTAAAPVAPVLADIPVTNIPEPTAIGSAAVQGRRRIGPELMRHYEDQILRSAREMAAIIDKDIADSFRRIED